MGRLKEKKKALQQRLEKESNKNDLQNISLKATSTTSKVSKKAKRLKKKTDLLKKLGDAYEEKQAKVKRKRKAQTVVVGDMDVLLDALPEVAIKTDNGNREEAVKQESVMSLPKKKLKSEKARKKAAIADISLFQKVLAHPKYQEDPVHAISDHVKYLMERDNPTQS